MSFNWSNFGRNLQFLVPLLLDRWVKRFVIVWNPSNYKINNFLSFDLVYNKGVSWGLLHSDSSYMNWFVILVSAALIFAILYYIGQEIKKDPSKSIIGENFILAGAVSNLIDRFVYPGVVDFIKIDLGFYVWPTFNLADMFIVVGVLIIFFRSFCNSYCAK